MGPDSRACFIMISKREIYDQAVKDSVFFQKLNSSLQKKFITLTISFLKKKKIVFQSGTTDDDSFRIQTGIAFSTLCLSEKSQQFLELFHTVEVYPENFCNSPDSSFEGKIQVRTCSDNSQSCNIIFDMAYGLYHSYLSSSIPFQHFSTHLGKAEMLLIDRYDFKKTTTIKLERRQTNDHPISWFAAATEFLVHSPEEMKIIDPDLFDALTLLWDFDYITIKTPVSNLPLKRRQRLLHPVYSFTIISIFISTFILISLCQTTLLPDWLLFFIVGLFACSGYFIRQFFIKFNIPVIPLPYVLFSIFGIGVNITAILLYINIALSTDINPKTTIIPQKHDLLKEFHNNSTTAFYKIEYRYNSQVKRELTFEAPIGEEVKFYLIEIKEGLIGIPYISELSTQSSQ
jgi:Mlc titration factor MtfA (ptsG expression regulator)